MPKKRVTVRRKGKTFTQVRFVKSNSDAGQLSHKRYVASAVAGNLAHIGIYKAAETFGAAMGRRSGGAQGLKVGTFTGRGAGMLAGHFVGNKVADVIRGNRQMSEGQRKVTRASRVGRLVLTGLSTFGDLSAAHNAYRRMP